MSGRHIHRRLHSEESGFTLIELITVIGIIGVLSALAMKSVTIYKSDAAYSVAEKTLRDGKIAFEAGLTSTETDPAPVPLTSQNAQGPVSNAAASALLPGMQIPRNTKFQVFYDPTCAAGACEQGRIQVDHCHSLEYVRWIRFGDGLEIELDHVGGSNCH